MIEIKNGEVYSTDGKIVHRVGTDIYFTRGMVFPATDVKANFEEVDAFPPYTKAEYDAKVAELVRERYTDSEEFALQRKAINAAFAPASLPADNANAMDEYAAYNAYVEKCKTRAKDPELYKPMSAYDEANPA